MPAEESVSFLPPRHSVCDARPHVYKIIVIKELSQYMARDQEMVVERSSPLSQSSDTTTATENVAWDLIDAEFSSIISPVHSRLSSGEVRPREAASVFASIKCPP